VISQADITFTLDFPALKITLNPVVSRSEDTMEEIYLWQSAYNAAVLETDASQRPTRYYEALAAIEERLPSISEKNTEEFRALTAADHAIHSLKTQSALQLRTQ
jgi:hypothetical protein